MLARIACLMSVALLLFTIPATSQDYSPSQYDAARKLLELTIPLKNTEIVQTVIDRISASRPELADKEDEIRGLIDEFLSSPDYMETGTRAVMYFFTEDELRDMGESLERGQGAGGDAERIALLKKYDKLLTKLEDMLASYFAGKFRNWHPSTPSGDSIP